MTKHDHSPVRSNPVLCLINNMQAGNNEGDVSGDDQAVQCFLLRLYKGTAFSPSPLNCGAGGGACTLPSTGRDRAFLYRRTLGRFSIPSGGCHRDGGRAAAVGAVRCGARRAGGDDGVARSAGGSPSGGPRRGKTHILKPEGFREQLWELPRVPLERPRPAYGIGERAPGHRSLFRTVNTVCRAQG